MDRRLNRSNEHDGSTVVARYPRSDASSISWAGETEHGREAQAQCDDRRNDATDRTGRHRLALWFILHGVFSNFGPPIGHSLTI